MSSPKPSGELVKTFGELKQCGYKSVPVKDELRANLVRKLRAGEKLFRGIVGYDETVIPQLVNEFSPNITLSCLGCEGRPRAVSFASLPNFWTITFRSLQAPK